MNVVMKTKTLKTLMELSKLRCKKAIRNFLIKLGLKIFDRDNKMKNWLVLRYNQSKEQLSEYNHLKFSVLSLNLDIFEQILRSISASSITERIGDCEKKRKWRVTERIGEDIEKAFLYFQFWQETHPVIYLFRFDFSTEKSSIRRYFFDNDDFD